MFLGLGIFLVWLSFRQLKPSLAKVSDGTFLMTPEEEWKPGAAVFAAKEDGTQLDPVADRSFILQDSTVVQVGSGKVSAIVRTSTGIKDGADPALLNSDLFGIKKSLREANYWWLLLSVAIGVLSHMIRAYRWGMLLQPMGYSPKFANSFFAVMVGYLVNYGVPRLGEISRCTIIDRYEKVPFTKAFGTVVAERLLDMLIFLVFFFVMLFTQYDRIASYMNENIYPTLNKKMEQIGSNKTMLILLAAGGLLFVAMLFVFRKKIKGKIAEKVKGFLHGFGEGLRTMRKVKKPASFLLLSVLIWVSYYFMLHVCFNCFSSSSHLGFSEGITAFVFGTFTVMLTPGGIGAYPYALQKVMYKVYKVPETVGFSLGWLSWMGGFISILSFGLLSLILLPVYNRKPVPEEEAGASQ